MELHITGLWINTNEADEAEREITLHARQRCWKLAVWDIASGLRLPGNNNGPHPESGAGDPLAALRALPALAERDGTALLLLHNFHRFLNNPEVVQTVYAQLVAGKHSLHRTHEHPIVMLGYPSLDGEPTKTEPDCA